MLKYLLDTANSITPHLVPLPKGEETLARPSFLPVSFNEGRKPTLASPIFVFGGRGARQRGEGFWCLSMSRPTNNTDTIVVGGRYV